MSAKLIADLTIPGSSFTVPDPLKGKFSDIGGVIGTLLNYMFPLAGIILFAMLVFGGFEMMTAAGNPDNMKKAQGRITSAILGFVIIFISYWLMQIVQLLFHLTPIISSPVAPT